MKGGAEKRREVPEPVASLAVVDASMKGGAEKRREFRGDELPLQATNLP